MPAKTIYSSIIKIREAIQRLLFAPARIAEQYALNNDSDNKQKLITKTGLSLTLTLDELARNPVPRGQIFSAPHRFGVGPSGWVRNWRVIDVVQ